MKLLYATYVLLATILTVNGASVYSSSLGNTEVFSGNNFYSNGASIDIKQVDGRLTLRLDGKLINLDAAEVVSEDENYKVLSPVEVKGARVTIDKKAKQIAVDYKGANYQSMTPEMVNAQVTQAMAEVQKQMSQLQNHLKEVFANTIFRPGFPFN